MNKYEAMFIIKPDLSEDNKKVLFNNIAEAITKHQGVVTNAAVWAERRKFYFPIKKHLEGAYYLVNFDLPPLSVKDIRNTYKLNEDILRVLISNIE